MLTDFTKIPFDIIIQAGQSNSEGCGMGPLRKPFAVSHLNLNNDFTICPAAERVWGNEIVNDFSLSFGHMYTAMKNLTESRKLLIVRAAVGGTGFGDKRWIPEGDLYLRMMDMVKTALSLNPSNRLAGMLWHQGETDAILNTPGAAYYDYLGFLVRSVRDTFGAPELPFICGDFVQHWKNDNAAVCEPIIAAQRRLCDDLVSARFVETVGLESNDQRTYNGDTIHFCREALFRLGLMYYEAWAEITE